MNARVHILETDGMVDSIFQSFTKVMNNINFWADSRIGMKFKFSLLQFRICMTWYAVVVKHQKLETPFYIRNVCYI